MMAMFTKFSRGFPIILEIGPYLVLAQGTHPENMLKDLSACSKVQKSPQANHKEESLNRWSLGDLSGLSTLSLGLSSPNKTLPACRSLPGEIPGKQGTQSFQSKQGFPLWPGTRSLVSQTLCAQNRPTHVECCKENYTSLYISGLVS